MGNGQLNNQDKAQKQRGPEQPPSTFGATRVSKSDLIEIADARNILPKIVDLFVPPNLRNLNDEQAEKVSNQFRPLLDFFPDNNSAAAHLTRQVMVNGVSLAIARAQSFDNYLKHLTGVAIDALLDVPVSASGLQRRQLITLIANSNIPQDTKNDFIVMLVSNAQAASNPEEKWALHNTIKSYVDRTPELKNMLEEFLSVGDDSARAWEIREKEARGPRANGVIVESDYYYRMSQNLDGLKGDRAWKLRQEIVQRSTTDEELEEARKFVLYGIKGIESEEALGFRKNNSHLYTIPQLLESLIDCKGAEAKLYQESLITSATKNIDKLSQIDISDILASTKDLDTDSAWALRITALSLEKLPVSEIISSVSGKHKSEGAQDFWEIALDKPGARNQVLSQLDGNSASFAEKLRNTTFETIKKNLPKIDHDTLFSLCFSLRGVKTEQANKIREAFISDKIPMPYRILAGGGVFTDIESKHRRYVSAKFLGANNPTALKWGELLLSTFRPNEYDYLGMESLSNAAKDILKLK